ncbi:glycerate kinase type-2 family protein [Vulgatibacter incomptus]|uniref:D-glycerate 2-kinase n=1 Tax=Vulgatibacter incomptus TaxID=1391653 RepID=A0A0K1PH01_9BACT|nr:DUF4147 domain-containing protein [Vulgatibacter incomptus]AKU92777.1 D-glycerate 2-kinase [Vulgatibacter incomptus]
MNQRDMLRNQLIEIFEAAVASLAGDLLVREAIARHRESLPADPRSIAVIALGKAAGPMARGALDALGPLAGIVAGPPGTRVPGAFEVVEGDHPVPGPRSIRAGIRLLAFARQLHREQTALVLLSGGASALAEALPSSLSLLDLARTNRLLLGAGAPIDEINVIRKHLSRTKGGRLAAASEAGRIELLAISDVSGDDPAVIGSGPFSPDPSTYEDAREIVRRRGIEDELPEAVKAILEAAEDESPKPRNPIFNRLHTRILAGPARLAEVAMAEAARRGFEAEAWPGFVDGDVEDVAARYLAWLDGAKGKRRLLVASAEPTVTLPAHPGRGGRSQQLALLMATALGRRPDLRVTFLAAGTDGRDGVSDHAGAVVDSDTARRAQAAGFDLDEALAWAASEAACDAVGAALPCFDSPTNLADLHLLAVE